MNATPETLADVRNAVALVTGVVLDDEDAESVANAALAVMPAPQPVAVKPLEWSAYNEGFGHGRTYYGTGVFCHWYAVKRERNKVWSCLHHVGKEVVHLPYFRSLDEAKAAAQADYEARILSTLTTPPAAISSLLSVMGVRNDRQRSEK